MDDCQRYPNLKILWLRKVGKSAKESFEDLRAKVFGRIPHTYKSHSGTVTFPNGSRIILGNFFAEKDIDKYLGLEYDAIGVEEATTLTASKIKNIETCLRTSKPNWRPRIYFTTNPGGVSHAYFKARFIEPYRSGTQTNTRFIPATVDDNPFTNKEYRGVLDTLTGWQLKAWRYGDWDIAAGQFFTDFSAARHVVPRFRVPTHWRMWGAFDYGWTHYSAFYVFAQRPDGVVFVVGEYGKRKTLPRQHAIAMRELARSLGGTFDRLDTIVAGPDCWAPDSEGKTIAGQYADLPDGLGIQFKQAINARVIGAAMVASRLGSVAAGIEPTVYLTTDCPRLAVCLPMLEHNPHKPEDVLKVDVEEDGASGDDWYDAFRYGLMEAARRDSGAVSWEN